MLGLRNPLLIGAMGLCVILPVLSGCTTRIVYDSWAQMRQMAGGDRDKGGKDKWEHRARRRDLRDGRWALLLQTFTGDKHQQAAEALVAQLRSEVRLSDVWLHNAVDRTLVFRGNYAEPNSHEALNAQRQTRMVKLDSRRAFAEAQLVPIAAAGTAVAGPHDLCQYHKLYSLQVEVYDEQIGSEYPKVAEDRVRILRKAGERAFFYHGPFRSMVTIGLFTYKQAFVLRGTSDRYAPVIRELQEKFPLNLYNGHTAVEKKGGKKIRDQRSCLVHVP